MRPFQVLSFHAYFNVLLYVHEKFTLAFDLSFSEVSKRHLSVQRSAVKNTLTTIFNRLITNTSFAPLGTLKVVHMHGERKTNDNIWSKYIKSVYDSSGFQPLMITSSSAGEKRPKNSNLSILLHSLWRRISIFQTKFCAHILTIIESYNVYNQSYFGAAHSCWLKQLKENKQIPHS